MDHLPSWDASKQLRIPCAKSSTYVYQGFAECLQTYCVAEDNVEVPTESFLHDVVFFSVLHDFASCAEIVVVPEDVIFESEEGDLSLTMKTFQDIVIKNIRTKAVVKANRKPSRTAAALNFQHVLKSASGILTDTCREVRMQDHVGIRNVTFVFLIGFLETLNHTLSYLFDVFPIPLRLPILQQYIEGTMLENGWCQSKIQDLVHFGACAGYLATRLEPPERMRMDDHSMCNELLCLPGKSRQQYVRPKHVRDCDGHCPDLSIDIDALESAILDEYIPIINIHRTAIKTELRVVRRRVSTRTKRYVAISHVWAQGLGNEDGNALPLCQIQRISTSMTRDYPGRALWIDTLCIPRYPKGTNTKEQPAEKGIRERTCRLMAIRRMAEVYELADAVIVLDEYLETIDTNKYNRQLAFICSDWMTRLWTLQEAIKGFQRLYIKFRNGLVSIHDLLSVDPLEPSSQGFTLASDVLDEEINGSVVYEFSDFLFPDPSARDHTVELFPLISSLRRRTTTKPEDEYMCLVTILNIKPELIFQEPSMADILINLESIPEDLVFLPGERLRDSGLQWAPSTFLSQPASEVPAFSETNGVSLLSAQGRFMGLLVCKDVFWIHNFFTFRPFSTNVPDMHQAYAIVDRETNMEILVFRADRSIQSNSAQLQARQIPSSSETNNILDDVWDSRTSFCAAALIMNKAYNNAGSRNSGDNGSSSDDIDHEDGEGKEEVAAENGEENRLTTKAPERAVLMSNIHMYKSNRDPNEVVFSGKFELLVTCFEPARLIKEIRQSEVVLPASFQARVPFALV